MFLVYTRFLQTQCQYFCFLKVVLRTSLKKHLEILTQSVLGFSFPGDHFKVACWNLEK